MKNSTNATKNVANKESSKAVYVNLATVDPGLAESTITLKKGVSSSGKPYQQVLLVIDNSYVNYVTNRIERRKIYLPSDKLPVVLELAKRFKELPPESLGHETLAN